MDSFLNKIQKYLHPEATIFYRQLSHAVDQIYKIQNEIDDPENRWMSGLGGKSYPYYAFENHKNYNDWSNDIEKIYSLVKTYDDLIETNILYLQGKMPFTFYHYSPIYDIQTNDLQKITKKLKYFTMEGQSNYCDQETKQKPYIRGVIPTYIFKKILPQLSLNDEYFYEAYIIKTKEYITNIPYQRYSKKEWRSIRYPEQELEPMDEESLNEMIEPVYNLTLELNDQVQIPFTNAWQQGLVNNYDLIKNSEKLSSLVKDEIKNKCTILQIVGKDYCKGSIENLLLSLI